LNPLFNGLLFLIYYFLSLAFFISKAFKDILHHFEFVFSCFFDVTNRLILILDKMLNKTKGNFSKSLTCKYTIFLDWSVIFWIFIGILGMMDWHFKQGQIWYLLQMQARFVRKFQYASASSRFHEILQISSLPFKSGIFPF
jgi:hypothetical protein